MNWEQGDILIDSDGDCFLVVSIGENGVWIFDFQEFELKTYSNLAIVDILSKDSYMIVEK